MNDDLISRQAVIDYLMTNMNWHDEDGYTVEDADEKRAIITDLINGVTSAHPDKELSAWQEEFRGYIKMLNLPNDDYKGIMEYINEVPPAQSIIHCGTCKWFQCNMRPDGYLPKGVDEFECRHWCGPCDPVDFCSRAERREE